VSQPIGCLMVGSPHDGSGKARRGVRREGGGVDANATMIPKNAPQRKKHNGWSGGFK